MSDTEVYLAMDVEKIASEYEDGVFDALQKAAERMVEDAKRRFMAKTKRTGSGEMERGFFDFKSFYADGGWVGGVFGKRTDWKKSVGGRAHFFEYGRSAPRKGKDSTGKPQPVRQRPQRPRPFLRPARNKIKRELGGITSQELTRIAKKLNRSKVADSIVQSALNKI